jgi:hypothetical protein
VARYASRWCIEVAFSDACQILGVGQARTRTRRSVHRTVPFGLICLRRVIIAARFRPPIPYQASPEEARAVLLAWAAAET